MTLFGLGRKQAPPPPRAAPRMAEGLRVYAIGDVHGRFDLLLMLLDAIEADDRARGQAETHVVMLGDLIDRGPHSAQVVDFFRTRAPDFAQFHFVLGNHEEMLLRLIDAPSEEDAAHFLRYGGRETFQSYGAPQYMLEFPERYSAAALTDHVPEAHRAFLRGFHDAVQFGDYLFVHAGICPGAPIDQQAPADLRWIREPFLESEADHGLVVVHGHTIAEAPEIRPNRIGIDTGAYASGVLTALGLERDERWLLATAAEG